LEVQGVPWPASQAPSKLASPNKETNVKEERLKFMAEAVVGGDEAVT
jgi:hypothetical protein